MYESVREREGERVLFRALVLDRRESEFTSQPTDTVKPKPRKSDLRFTNSLLLSQQ